MNEELSNISREEIDSKADHQQQGFI